MTLTGGKKVDELGALGCEEKPATQNHQHRQTNK